VGTPFMVTASLADTGSFAVVPVDSSALAQWVRSGPAVKQAEMQYNSAHTAALSAKSTYLPSISLSYRYSGNRQDSSYTVSAGPYAFGNTFSVNVSYPLFNNFSREDQALRARVSEDNAAANYRDARLLAQQNLVQQLGALRTAEARIQIQQASVAAAQEDLRVQNQRYTLGASTLLDLLTSQSTLNQARAALIQARQDYRIARAQIEAVIGRDLQ
ncbi:MAG TPA: TolC family protein, partial [Burkholderiales bacterium]